MADETKKPEATAPAKHECPFCNPRIFTVAGEQRVMWNIAGIQISTSVVKALDLLQHIQAGLIFQATGHDVYAESKALLDKINGTAPENPAAPLSDKKEYLN